MFRTIPITLFIVFSSLSARCQDTGWQKIRFHIGFESIGQQHLYDMNSQVSQPSLIKRDRKMGTGLPISFDTITDNPYQHGAMYTVVKTSTHLANKLLLKADLYAEYRGFSYGTFHKNNLVVFPVVEVRGKDTLTIGKNSLLVEGKVGQFLNERLDEGLMIYNIDLQGTQVKFRYKNAQLTGTIYGDLANAIGLNIDDLKALSYEHYLENDSAKLGISWVIAAPPDGQARHHSYFNIYGNRRTRNGWELFAQLSYKPVYNNPFDIFYGLDRQLALLAGFQKEYEKGRFYFRNRTELRYYGHTYNAFHDDHAFRYRNSAYDAEGMYANTTGEYLYPLRKFQTPFSQWAVFTEYSSYNLGAVGFTGECRYTISNKLSVGTDYDINAIWAKLDKVFYDPGDGRSSSFFIYPFFKTWVRYFPVQECYLSLFMGNRSMNLDISYPTHYLLKKPFVGIEFYCKI